MQYKLKNLVNEIKKKGYIILPNVISKNKCEKFKKILNKNFEIYKDSYCGINKDGLANKQDEKVVFNLHNKNYEFFELFQHKNVLDILDILLKEGSYKNDEPYYLNNISARCPLKGNKGQLIHLDSNLAGVNYNIIVNVMWLLDDFDEKNGSTYVVPKSHLVKKYANNNNKIRNKILVKAKKGSVIIFNANLWHGGSEKKNQRSRWAILLGYARWFIKPSFDYMQNTPINIFNKLSSKQKSLLGFDLVPPKDEFTRITRRSVKFEVPSIYNLKK